MYRMMFVIALCAMHLATVRAASPVAEEKIASFQFLGGMVDTTGRPRPRNEWSLFIIERLFDNIRTRWKLETRTYDAIGHSGGAQFLHRLVLFVPEARVARAIASSPGRYAFPTPAKQIPYGMGGTDATLC